MDIENIRVWFLYSKWKTVKQKAIHKDVYGVSLEVFENQMH